MSGYQINTAACQPRFSVTIPIIDDSIPYRAGVDASSWQAPAPSTVGEAIARLAIALQGLLGEGNIPLLPPINPL